MASWPRQLTLPWHHPGPWHECMNSRIPVRRQFEFPMKLKIKSVWTRWTHEHDIVSFCMYRYLARDTMSWHCVHVQCHDIVSRATMPCTMSWHCRLLAAVSSTLVLAGAHAAGYAPHLVVCWRLASAGAVVPRVPGKNFTSTILYIMQSTIPGSSRSTDMAASRDETVLITSFRRPASRIGSK